MSSTAFASRKFSWLERVTRDHGLLPSDVRVATALLPRFNEEEGGRAYPGYQRIAADTGMMKRTVIACVRRLEASGHLRVVPGKAGAGHTNNYFMTDGDAKKRGNADTFSRAKKGQTTTRKGIAVAPDSFLNPKHAARADRRRAPHAERERAFALAGSPIGDAADADAPRAADELKKKADQPLNGEVLAPAHDEEEKLAALIALWARGHAADRTAAAQQRTRAAWQMACAAADPVAIIDGARVWIAAADAPRFLPKLDEWLAGRGWEQSPPPRGRTRTGSRTPRKRSGDNGSSGVSLAEMVRRAGRR